MLESGRTTKLGTKRQDGIALLVRESDGEINISKTEENDGGKSRSIGWRDLAREDDSKFHVPVTSLMRWDADPCYCFR